MIITGIRPLRKGLCQIYIDGEPAVKIDQEVLLLSPFQDGSAIDDEELRELIQQSDTRRAREKALYLLERRSHSKKELAEKIAAVAPREAAKEAAEHMEEIGLVNDEEFARMYARDLFNRKKLGAGRVKMELAQKGIDKEVIAEVVAEYGGDQGENARLILNRKYPMWAEDEKVKRRAVAALQRMGYRWDEIKNAMKGLEEYD